MVGEFPTVEIEIGSMYKAIAVYSIENHVFLTFTMTLFA